MSHDHNRMHDVRREEASTPAPCPPSPGRVSHNHRQGGTARETRDDSSRETRPPGLSAQSPSSRPASFVLLPSPSCFAAPFPGAPAGVLVMTEACCHRRHHRRRHRHRRRRRRRGSRIKTAPSPAHLKRVVDAVVVHHHELVHPQQPVIRDPLGQVAPHVLGPDAARHLSPHPQPVSRIASAQAPARMLSSNPSLVATPGLVPQRRHSAIHRTAPLRNFSTGTRKGRKRTKRERESERNREDEKNRKTEIKGDNGRKKKKGEKKDKKGQKRTRNTRRKKETK